MRKKTKYERNIQLGFLIVIIIVLILFLIFAPEKNAKQKVRSEKKQVEKVTKEPKKASEPNDMSYEKANEIFREQNNDYSHVY